MSKQDLQCASPDDVLTQGTLCPYSHTAATCANLLTLEPALWTFVSHTGVEPTHNAAERALRHPVI